MLASLAGHCARVLCRDWLCLAASWPASESILSLVGVLRHRLRILCCGTTFAAGEFSALCRSQHAQRLGLFVEEDGTEAATINFWLVVDSGAPGSIPGIRAIGGRRIRSQSSGIAKFCWRLSDRPGARPSFPLSGCLRRAVPPRHPLHPCCRAQKALGRIP